MPPHCDWLISNVSQWWSQWLPADAMTTFLIGGYFSVRRALHHVYTALSLTHASLLQVLVEPGLRVVALNTNFYDAWDPYVRPHNMRHTTPSQLAHSRTFLLQSA